MVEIATKYYSILLGDTEYYVQYPLNFNPFENLAGPRIMKQTMLEGVNYQESNICHSDGKFIISGQWMDSALQEALWKEYQKLAGDRGSIKFANNLTGESWQVIIASFIPYPQDVIYRQAQTWSLELLIVGKYIDGELVT